ncbi:MAG: hypothetical protein AAGE84_12990 [Cyanobacteria bacterium P01_G01_bin.39]
MILGLIQSFSSLDMGVVKVMDRLRQVPGAKMAIAAEQE